jgi:hypothetical protein
MTATSHNAQTASAHIAVVAGVAGLLGVLAYVIVAALPHGADAAPVASSLVGPLTRPRASRSISSRNNLGRSNEAPYPRRGGSENHALTTVASEAQHA